MVRKCEEKSRRHVIVGPGHENMFPSVKANGIRERGGLRKIVAREGNARGKADSDRNGRVNQGSVNYGTRGR